MTLTSKTRARRERVNTFLVGALLLFIIIIGFGSLSAATTVDVGIKAPRQACSNFATDKNGRYMEHGVGLNSCEIYVSARSNPAEMTYFINYISGYFTALNIFMAETYSILDPTDPENIFPWLDTYCVQNPSTHFAVALAFLAKELVPTRLRTRP